LKFAPLSAGIVAALQAGLLLAACSKEGAAPAGSAAPSAPWFEEVAQPSGVDFRHMRGLTQRFWFPEIMCAGLCWIDYDGDGHPDLFVVQSGDIDPGERSVPGCKLFHNLGNGKFEDVSARAGIAGHGYGVGCTAGDYDGDGRVDLYVTYLGPNILYHNNGDGTFSDVTAQAGVGDAGWGSSCGFVDIDGDGDLDLFLVNYVRWKKETEIPCKSPYGERDYCAPNNYNAPSQCVLFINDGNGHFHDGSAQAGLAAAFGNGLGLALADFDGDGRTDVYVSNDGMPNQLWMNRGGGKLVDEALVRGCAVNRNGAAQASMGTVVADFDQDGDPDLFITNLRNESTTLYDNDGKGNLRDVSARTGMATASQPYTGFGDGAFDFDLDGVIDIFVVNGRVGFWKPYYSQEDLYAEPKQLFRGIDGKRFEEVAHGGLAADLLGTSRGAAFADYDDDGGIDVAVNENNGQLRLLRNIAQRKGHWVELDVRNRVGAPALQARVSLPAGARTLVREVHVCSSYASADDPRVHIGLGPVATLGRATVRWPDGTSESFGPLAVDHIHVLRQGTGQPVH
jgi:enediyne biosynthesis protein E4